jgi:ubiquinone/menaquinone biosynthesis C-methylase UbiE
MEQIQKTYLPAAGQDWMLPIYDPLVKLLGGDNARRALLEHASINPGHRVLDIGCGTGTLVVQIKRLHPDADVVGLDPDARALARAKRKAERASLFVQFDQGFSDALPYQDASVDRIFSSFMFHHLQREGKQGMLREARRVLRHGGIFNLLDFDGPASDNHDLLARLIHSSHRLRDNSADRILELMRHAGFANPKNVRQGTMLFGRLRTNYYQVSVPR